MNQGQQVTVRIQEPDLDEIDCICRTSSSTIADYDFCKVYLPL